MGSIGAAAWIARIAFVALLGWGAWSGQLRRPALLAFAASGVLLWIALARTAGTALLVTPALAIVDIALVFAVFKGDLRIG
jgi:hypothetical protein